MHVKGGPLSAIIDKALLSQQRLAELTGVTRFAVRSWQNGQKPSRTSRERLARAFEGHADELRRLAERVRSDDLERAG
jgi:predicted transcriptional regulator